MRCPSLTISSSKLVSYLLPPFFEDWEEAYSNLRETLHLPSDEPIPKLPRTAAISAPQQPLATQPDTATTKRKADDHDGDVEMASENEEAKRAKTTSTAVISTSDASATTLKHAQAAASYIPFLETECLLPPKMPTRDEMESVLLDLRKKVLVEEYFGES